MKFAQKHILDELLVMRTQNGDMEAFSLLVKRWQPALLKQAYRLTRDDEAALVWMRRRKHGGLLPKEYTNLNRRGHLKPGL